jgi:hypothetical protein
MPFILHSSDDGQTCPYFRCDACGELVDCAADALLVWDRDQYNKPSVQPLIVHKGACDHKHDYLFSMQLDTALAYLLDNSGMTKSAMKRAQENAGLTAP